MRIFTLKTFLLGLCAIAFSTSVTAQDDAAKKEIVIIDNFKSAGDVARSYAQTIRNNVVAGFVKKGRFIVVDAATDAKLQALNAKKGEEGVDASNVMDETHSAAYKSLGAKFLVTGEATQYTCTRRRSSEGVVDYMTKIYLSLKVFNIETGETVVATQLNLMGFGDTQPEADAKANEDVAGKINSYIDKNFKFQTKILQLDEMKKNKVETLYINSGTTLGTKVSDTFTVYKVISVAGIKSKTDIGRLRVVEVAGPAVSKCKVTKGKVEITEEYNKGSELVIESLGKGGFGGFMEKADNLL